VGLAVSHLAAGEADTAFQELESAAAESPGTRADLILIRSALSRREFDKALAAVAALEKKQRNTPLVHNLRGVVLLGKRDIANARKSFELAVALDPAHFQAAANLALLDLADKKPEDAKKRFDSVLAKDPKNVPALLAIAELRARTGGQADEVAALIEKAIAADPAAPLPRSKLIAHRMRTNDARKAVAAGQDAVTALPNSPEVLDALARAQLAAGDTNQAVTSYRKLAQLQPNSPLPLLYLAGAQITASDRAAALQSLRKALAIQPDRIDAQRAIVMLEADSGRLPQAVAMAREVQKQRPQQSIGYVLEGDAYAHRKSWNEAVAAYRAALKQAGTVDAAVKLHEALVAAGTGTDAEAVATAWIKQHPKDLAFRLHLGQAALERGDFAAVVRQYRALVEAQPNNAAWLNNLAWAAGRANDPKAIEYAERAYRLAPDQAAIVDTLGTLLVEKGDKARGVELQQKASKLAPASPVIRLNLAKGLISTGQKDAAKKELEVLAKLGDKYKEHAEVEELMRGI
jgi:putative PEP-CTERM system TPR-repeat lipoprotein